MAGRSNIDLAGGIDSAPEVGSSYAVEWVDIDEPDPDVDGFTNDEAIVAVGDQGRDKGAAIFSRLEGAAIHGEVVYFTSTQGGQTPPGDVDPEGFGAGRGQIWACHVTRDVRHLGAVGPRRLRVTPDAGRHRPMSPPTPRRLTDDGTSRSGGAAWSTSMGTARRMP